ncbi:MAG: choline dehydrogenase [Pseudomonadota bacterium]
MDTFDFIVVGAGSAGCALAYRLSENPDTRVLLLEAGKSSHPFSPVPMGFAKLLYNPAANWCYEAQPEASLAERVIPVPRGRLLGGSSAINGLVFVRGQALDYDTWAQLGNRGWSYDDVLPVFRRMEHYENGTDELRAQGGPLRVREVPDENPLYDALFAAGEEMGLPKNPDYNGADQEGMCKTQTTISNGRRMSTAHCYLRPARRRDNLVVATEALTERLVLDGKRCVGVRYAQGSRTVEARANREVILSAGSINSPQLLELSGIGQGERLREHGIDVVHDLSGVGENLRDHLSPRMGWGISKRGVAYNDRARGLGLAWQLARYAVTREGFLSLPSAPILAFVKTREGLSTPDVQIHFMPYTYSSTLKLHKKPGMTVVLYQMRPESLGSIHIQDADPKTPPAINFNFLDNELDRQTTIDGVKWTRKIVDASAMDHLRGAEFKPGPSVQTDDEILDYVRQTAETAYHPVGTCKMGSDPQSVVNDRLQVHGIEGLRVADASIMPTLVSGNTNAASIMIGEKCAELISQSP